MPHNSSLTKRFLLATKYEEIHSLEQLQKSCYALIKLGNLIHQIQKERAMSNIFLASRSTLFCSQLSQQNNAVDEAKNVLFDALESDYLLTQPSISNARLLNVITYSLQSLDALTEIRAKIARQVFTPKQATHSFNQILSSLLNVFLEVADVASDPTITKILVSFFNFIQGKEYAGQERACGAAAFASNTFNDETHAQLSHLQQQQQQCFNFFLDNADELLTLAYKDFQSHKSGKEITKLRTMLCQLCQANNTELSQISEVWFEVTTARIDALHQVELKIADHLINCSAKQINISKRHLKDHKLALEKLGDSELEAPLTSYQVPDASLVANKFSANKTMYDLITEQDKHIRQISHALDEARTVLKEQKLINQAKYILIEQLTITENEAHKQLQKQAMNSQSTLAEIAQKVLSFSD